MSTLNVTTIIPGADAATNADLSLDGKGTGNVAVVDDATVGGDAVVTGNVGVGGASDFSQVNGLSVTGGGVPMRVVSSSSTSYIQLGASGTTAYPQIAINGDDLILRTSYTDKMKIEAGGNIDIESGNLFFSTAAKGVYLGVTSATAANLLDDYEYGNWTPGLTSTSATFGYTTQVGTYAKTGKLVMLNFRIALNGAPGGTTTNSVFISGAPFSQFVDSPYFGGHIGHFYNVNLDSGEQAGIVWQANGGTSFELKGVGDNQGEQSIITSQLGAAFEIRGSINYIAA